MTCTSFEYYNMPSFNWNVFISRSIVVWHVGRSVSFLSRALAQIIHWHIYSDLGYNDDIICLRLNNFDLTSESMTCWQCRLPRARRINNKIVYIVVVYCYDNLLGTYLGTYYTLVLLIFIFVIARYIIALCTYFKRIIKHYWITHIKYYWYTSIFVGNKYF